jgi:hypothetical protein
MIVDFVFRYTPQPPTSLKRLKVRVRRENLKEQQERPSSQFKEGESIAETSYESYCWVPTVLRDDRFVETFVEGTGGAIPAV